MGNVHLMEALQSLNDLSEYFGCQFLTEHPHGLILKNVLQNVALNVLTHEVELFLSVNCVIETHDIRMTFPEGFLSSVFVLSKILTVHYHADSA